jgi:hypothetical protein
MLRTLVFFLVGVAGCAEVTANPLVDLPGLRVVTPPASRGSPVVVEVINSTPHTVSFEALACDITLQQLLGGTWHPVPPEAGECIALAVALPPGATHPMSVDTPGGHGGRFRALLEGSSPAGPFVIRSQPFDVE